MNWQPLIDLLRDSVETVAPAIVCRVEQEGDLLFEGAVGWLDPETKLHPTQVDTIFDYASLTKLFTTTVCLALIEQGRFDLETPLVEIIPELGESKLLGGAEDPITKQPIPVDARWLDNAGIGGPQWYDTASVTIRRLLTHTSGLPAWRSVYRTCGAVPSSHAVMRQAEQAQRTNASVGALAAYPFIYPPGKSYVYSDIGLLLLGIAISRTYDDRPLQRAMTDFVLKPLNLAAAFLPAEALHDRIAPTEFCAWRDRRLVGEVHDENAAGVGGVAAHAGLFGTTHDLCRLGNLYREKGDSLLSPELVQTAVSEQYCSADGVRRGLGWMLRSKPNPSCSRMFSNQSFGHTGYTGTSLWCDPEQELSVALLTNRVYSGRDPKAIAQFRPTVHEMIAQIAVGA